MDNFAALILLDARVRRPGLPLADAVALRGGRVLGVGTAAALEGLAGPGTRRVRLGGAVVLPGLVDAHCHVIGLARTLAAADLRGADPGALVARAVAHAVTLDPGAWVEGSGWDQNPWPGAALPRHDALSAAIPDRPAVLWRVDGHAVLVNRAALVIAGIDRRTPDPADGLVVRDAAGEPTGVLVDGAMRLVTERQPELDPERLRGLVRQALARVAAAGLTGAHDMGLREHEIGILRDLDGSGRLTCRTHAYIAGEQPDWSQAVERARAPGALLTVAGVKLYQDGALGSRGAALDAPYCDDPGCRGLVLHEPEDLWDRVRAADRCGHQVAVHAIGDRAFGQVIDAFERLARAGRRPRVEHAQVATPALLQRAARVGAVLSMQPMHAVGDAPWAARRLGPERLAHSYAWGAALRAGCRLALGSDFPVEPMDPLAGLAAATGHHPGFTPGAPRALTPDEALQGYTEGPAWATFAEGRLGRLEPGYAADLTIVDTDPVGSPDALPAARVLATLVGGRAVFRHPEATFGDLD